MAKKKPQTAQTAKPGPAPETLKIDGDWQAAMGQALKKTKPATGWPKVPTTKERAAIDQTVVQQEAVAVRKLKAKKKG